MSLMPSAMYANGGSCWLFMDFLSEIWIHELQSPEHAMFTDRKKNDAKCFFDANGSLAESALLTIFKGIADIASCKYAMKTPMRCLGEAEAEFASAKKTLTRQVRMR